MATPPGRPAAPCDVARSEPRPPLAEPLLERAGLLDTLQSALSRATATAGAIVFLEGEAGVGKTSVARALAMQPSVPVTVLWGACDALATPRPLGPLHDMAFNGALRVGEALEQRRSTHELFTTFLYELQVPTLVVVEDLHWADEATLDLLRFVGRRVGQTRALIVATLRHDELGPHHPLRSVMGDLATLPVLRMRVEPLSRDAVRRIADGNAIDADRLYEATGGNPFYVSEVLAATGWTVPQTVRDAVLTRVGRLSSDARAVLETVSVEPGSMQRRMLSMLGLLDDAIWALLDQGVLIEDAGRVRFRHELARQAVADSVPSGRRAGLHRQLLALLESEKLDDPARLAHHAARAGDAQADLRWSAEAAQAASRAGAHREAAEQYSRALSHERLLEPIRHAELLERLAEELIIVDQPARAVESWDRAVVIRQAAGDVAGAATAMAHLARAKWTAGDAGSAYALIEVATEAADTLPFAERPATPYAVRGYLAMLARRCDEAVDWARRGQRAAEANGDEAALATALNALGSARIVGFDEIDGVADLERSAEIAARLGLPRALTTAWTNIGSALGEVRRYDVASRYLERAFAYATDRDLDLTRHYAVAWLARIRFETGQWPDAEKLLGEALRKGVSPISPIVALCVLGRLRARRGEPGARELLDEAWELASSTGDLQRLWPVAAGRAEVAWLTDEPSDAVAADLAAVHATAHRARLSWAIGELAFWMVRLGAGEVDVTLAATPFAASLAGNHALAAAAWAQIGCPYEEAWALSESDDEMDMRAGLAALMALGAQPLAERLRRSMRAKGLRGVPVGPRRTTAAAAGGLTEREREVLGLLALGLTDRDIGARLYVSPKTASHHVSAILGKLGVRSRTEAAAEAHRMGLSPPQDGQSSR